MPAPVLEFSSLRNSWDVQWDGNTNTVVISSNGAGASTGTPGEGLSNFSNQTGLGITSWSVKLDKFGERKNYRAVVTGKITNNNQTTTTLNWSWFLIRKPGQNAQSATLDSLLFNASDFNILSGDSVDMNLSFSIPIGDTPSDYQMFIKSNDGSLIPVSTLTGYQDSTNYSLATGTDIGDYGVQDGFEKAVGDDALTVVDYLLQQGKTGKDVDSKGEPVLKYAIDSGDPDMIYAIVKAGADVNISIDGMLPSEYASKTSKLAAIMELQKLGARNSGTPDGIAQGSYELVAAVVNHKTDAVKQLLDSGASPDSEEDGMTALMVASQFKYNDIVQLLLDKGANTELKSGSSSNIFSEVNPFNTGSTALMVALDTKNSGAVNLLISHKANVNATDVNGATPLMYASNMDDAADVSLLLTSGANINAADKAGTTPLIYAAKSDYADIVKILLPAGADVNAKDQAGKTALQYAQDKDYSDIISLLQPLNSSTQSGSTAVQPAPAVLASIGQGNTPGSTEISVPIWHDGLHDHLVYVLVNSPTPVPNVGDTAPTGTAYTSSSDINLTGNNSKYIDIYEVNGNGKVVAFKEFQIDPVLDIAH